MMVLSIDTGDGEPVKLGIDDDCIEAFISDQTRPTTLLLTLHTSKEFELTFLEVTHPPTFMFSVFTWLYQEQDQVYKY